MTSLIIVESPTKSRTISKFLGKDYKIVASIGHVRDLPKSELGVDVEKEFEPKYVIPTKARKTVSALRKEAKKADEIILATDEDREGESISWHLKEALSLDKPKRIVFHEITEEAILEALKNPRTIDMNLVHAQQARRVLDRIVGYKLSPFLWKKIVRGLSAGRVQSVAVKLVCEKEEEIKNFIAVEYWQIKASLNHASPAGRQENNNTQFEAHLIKKDGKRIEKLEIQNKALADQILQDLENASYVVESIESKESARNPLPPFTTSTMVQTAANRFGFPSRMTMSLAQKLYEQGFITYHRTDSLNLSSLSLNAVQKFITETYGAKYHKLRTYKAGKGAQEAHEAVRPTYANKTPDSVTLDSRQKKLYTLIWQRFCASQMEKAIFDATSVEISAGKYTFGVNGQMLKFDGFLKVYPMKFQEAELPKLSKKESLQLVKLESSQHFTEPPARYNEASLIKALEQHEIGRPSTYAPTLSVIQERNYIAKNEQKRFYPTEMGGMVNSLLVEHFPQIVDIDFTAKMEKELDEVAEGKDTWQRTVKDFYGPFAKNLEEKYEEVKKQNTDIKTDKVCPQCGKPMVEKLGKFGRFYACSGFPDCKHTESLENLTDHVEIDCPKCKKGKIVYKKTRRGKFFYGCNTYPACDFAVWDKPIKEFCPKCLASPDPAKRDNSILVETKAGKVKCSNKDCDYKKV